VTVERAVQLLRRMGWGVSPRDHAYFLTSPHGLRLTPVWEDLPEICLAELAKREDVMERVVDWLNEFTGYLQWDSPDMEHQQCLQFEMRGCVLVGGASSLETLLTVAQVRGMTDDELLGGVVEEANPE